MLDASNSREVSERRASDYTHERTMERSTPAIDLRLIIIPLAKVADNNERMRRVRREKGRKGEKEKKSSISAFVLYQA